MRALIALILLLVAGLETEAASHVPLEPCYTHVAQVYPVSPTPWHTIKVVVTNCGSKLDVEVYWYPVSGGYELVTTFTTTEYIYEFYVGPFYEEGCLEIWLDGQVAKRVAVGDVECGYESPLPGNPGSEGEREDRDDETGIPWLWLGAGALAAAITIFIAKRL